MPVAAPLRGRLSIKAAQAAGRGSHLKLRVDDKDDEHIWHLAAEQPASKGEWVLQRAGDAIEWSAPMVGKALIAAVLLACVWMVVRASLGGYGRSRSRSLSVSDALCV
eukprot:COSAG05_NODE_1314_length_5213_cov_3.285100_3_plen_108_part_00